MLLLLSSISFVLSTAESFSYPDGKIVGGEPVEITQYPSTISLQKYRYHLCGGTIISEKYILTAAHCVSGSRPHELTIRAGSSYHAKEGNIYQIETIYAHPKFGPKVDYDIAILKLKDSLNFDSSIQPIGLPELNEDVPEGSKAVALGWGALKENGKSPQKLQGVTVPVVSLENCRKAYGAQAVTERMICAGYPEGGKDACQGDSGGPLLFNGKIIGITSWGRGCARPKLPGVYASVPNLRDFVYNITRL